MSNQIFQVTGDIKGKFVGNINNVDSSQNNEPAQTLPSGSDNKSKTTIRYNRIIMWIAVVLAVVLSVLALVRSYPTNYGELYFDWYGIIVAILGIMVTLLVGWQIYNVIDARQVLRNIDVFEKRIDVFEKRMLSRMKKTEDKIEEFRAQLLLHGEAYLLYGMAVTFSHNVYREINSKINPQEKNTAWLSLSNAYLSAFKAFELFLKANSEDKFLLLCLDQMEFCLIEKEMEFDGILFNDCKKIYTTVQHSSNVSKEIKNKLNDVYSKIVGMKKFYVS